MSDSKPCGFFYCDKCGGKLKIRKRMGSLVSQPHDTEDCVVSLAARVKALEDHNDKEKASY